MRTQKLVILCCAICTLSALFWASFYLFFDSVPAVTSIRIVENWKACALPFSVSHWWDILCGPLYLALIITSLTRKKDAKISGGLAIGLAVSMVFGLAAGLIFGLGSSLVAIFVGGMSICLVVDSRTGRAVGLSVSLVSGLGIGLGVSLVFGLAIGLVFGLITCLVFGFGIFGTILIRLIIEEVCKAFNEVRRPTQDD